MFLKLRHYFGLMCLAWACVAGAENAPSLADLGVHIKQSEDKILSQITNEVETQIVGYFDAKSAKMRKKPHQNSQFVRKTWGKNENGDFILQDFYLHDESDTLSLPMTSLYVLPKTQNPKRKQVMGRVQAAAFALYRENGLPEKIMLFDENQRMNKAYYFNEIGAIDKMFDLSDGLSMWLFYENGAPKTHVNGAHLQAWYQNGQKRLLSQKNGESQIWQENGQLYYQNTENKIVFFHENGKPALELSGNHISAWDEHGEAVQANHAAILKQHLTKVKQIREEILNEINMKHKL